MSVQSELLAQRRVTDQFIAASPITLSLYPANWVSSPSAGRVRSVSAPRDAQVFRLIDQSSSVGNSPGPQRAGDGTQRASTHQLLGPPGAVMQVGDWWTGSDGKRYEIAELFPDNGYERRARVTCYG
jgi:hypothetical protein